jgi:hypothetical protein|nr:MAG TPA: hypothetical protein [Caudoviricetes sp.]
MKRLTHEADFGLEDWEQTFFKVESDPHGAYNILDIAMRQGEEEFDNILISIALRLAEIEDILGEEYDLDSLEEALKGEKRWNG